MKTLLISLIGLSVSFSLCAQSSGIEGKVIEVKGNQMPSSTASKKGENKGASKELFVYELTKQNQATKEAIFYKKISTRLIAKAKTKSDGTFKIKLKPGRYSLFVLEKDGLYFANEVDAEGNINSVKVESHHFTKRDLRVDYDAAY